MGEFRTGAKTSHRWGNLERTNPVILMITGLALKWRTYSALLEKEHQLDMAALLSMGTRFGIPCPADLLIEGIA